MFATLTLPLVQTFAAACSKPTFFGLVPWYQYLTLGQDAAHNCVITNFDASGGVQDGILGAHSPFLLIALAVLDDLIRVAALVAVGYIIVGGVTYMTSQGSPDMTRKAQSTIINALIGLATALIAASLVSFLGNKLGTA